MIVYSRCDMALLLWTYHMVTAFEIIRPSLETWSKENSRYGVKYMHT
jgi:hypothetical protein